MLEILVFIFFPDFILSWRSVAGAVPFDRVPRQDWTWDMREASLDFIYQVLFVMDFKYICSDC